jgi:hypothetical protein
MLSDLILIKLQKMPSVEEQLKVIKLLLMSEEVEVKSKTLLVSFKVRILAMPL